MEVLQRTANRGSISTGYDIDNSLKLEIDNNEWIYRSSPTAGNRRTFTISLWLKRACLGHRPAGSDEYLAGQGSNARYHFAGDTVRFMFESNSTELESTRVLRDSSAWYHIVLAVDTTQATAADRVKLYINGEQQSWSNTKYPSQNQESDWMNTQNLYIGTRYAGDGDNDLAGYISEVVVLDGTQASPTDFGEYDEDSGIWKPKDLSDLTFGSEGFYYKFDNASSLGEDSSGNGNDATLNNITAADQATDTPTNNFATLNPLWYFEKPLIISDGATKVTSTGSPAGWQGARGSMGVANGKWYWEQKFSGSDSMGGISDSLAESDAGNEGNGGGTLVIPMNDNNVYFYDPNGRAVSFTKTFTTSDIWGFALNMDDDEISFYRNGSLVNSAVALSSYLINLETFFPVVLHYSTGVTSQLNFGGYTGITISSGASDANGYGTFEYAPPSGYYAICTKNLAEYG